MTKNVASSFVNNKRTICEVHREIYDILESEYKNDKNFSKVVEKLEEAYIMAKKMSKKLEQYKFEYDDTWWKETHKEILQEKLYVRKKR